MNDDPDGYQLLGFDWLQRPASADPAKRATPDPAFGETLGCLVPAVQTIQYTERPVVFPNSPEALAIVVRSVARSSAMRWN